MQMMQDVYHVVWCTSLGCKRLIHSMLRRCGTSLGVDNRWFIIIIFNEIKLKLRYGFLLDSHDSYM